MINLNQLRSFYEAAKHLNFTKAAKALYITQPAVTSQVKAFEDHLEIILFRKKGGKLHLTEEGKAIYRLAERIFQCESEIEKTIHELKNLQQGSLRLGTARTYARYFVPFLVSRFREHHPHIQIHLDEGSSQDMMQSLVAMQNDIAIIAKTEDHPHVRFSPFSREELILIIPPDHPFAGSKSIPIQQLGEEPIVMKENGSGTRKLVDALFREHGINPKIMMETSDAEMIKLLVQHGEGISFLVREAVAPELLSGKLAGTGIEGNKLFLDVSIAYLKSEPLSPPGRAFLEKLQSLGTKELRFQGMGALMAQMKTSDI